MRPCFKKSGLACHGKAAAAEEEFKISGRRRSGSLSPVPEEIHTMRLRLWASNCGRAWTSINRRVANTPEDLRIMRRGQRLSSTGFSKELEVGRLLLYLLP